MSMRSRTSSLLLAGVAFTGLALRGQHPQSVAADSGDAARGEKIFAEKGQCLSCHRVRDKGSRLGLDLTAVGAQRTAEELEKSLLDPNPEVLPQNRTYRAVTRDGTAYTGKLLNQDAFSIQILDSKERLLGLQKSELRESGFIATPPMPSYRSKLSAPETADLVAYLTSLKGVAQ